MYVNNLLFNAFIKNRRLVTPIMYLIEEVVQQVVHIEIPFQCCWLINIYWNVLCKKRDIYQHESFFDRVLNCSQRGLRFIVLQYCCSDRSRSNDCFRNLHSMGTRASFKIPMRISVAHYYKQSRRHLTFLALMNHTPTATALSLNLETWVASLNGMLHSTSMCINSSAMFAAAWIVA